MFYKINCLGEVISRRERKKGREMEIENKNPKKKAEAEASTNQIKKTNQEK